MLLGVEEDLRTVHSPKGLKIQHGIKWSKGCCEGTSERLASLGRETGQSLAYNLHEDLLPVLTGLETMTESRTLWEELELLLQECLPFQIISIRLEGRFPFVGCL